MTAIKSKINKSKSQWVPTLRHPDSGWKHLVAVVYALVANLVGLFSMLQCSSNWHSSSNYGNASTLILAILLSCHGRVIATYMVHESCHGNIFVQSWANALLGTVCLWLAGCPYANYEHVKFMHNAHHKDRADTVEFDYRDFVKKQPWVFRQAVLGLEWCCVPIVETIMHFRSALSPLLDTTCKPGRRQSAWIGSFTMLLFYVYLWQHGALLPELIMGALLLHFLSYGDAFHHTFEAVMLKDYTPGPGGRTPKFEEENTYSNVVSTGFPLLNLLALNFGYHNAHHKKPMVPWYGLPDYHDKIYGSLTSPAARKQLLPATDIRKAYFLHRVRRVLDEDYGVVHPPGTPGRANDFVGTLGVSFLTV
jgi:fatty acid desaturase